MISLKCSRSSKKRRMEDRDVSGYEDHSSPRGRKGGQRSGRLSATLNDNTVCQELSTLHTVLNSALPGGDYPAAGLVTGIARPDRLLQPPALGQDWAPSSTIPKYRCLPDYDIARDYGLFVSKLPVTIAMSGPRGDITGNTEDDLPLPVRTLPCAVSATSGLAPGYCTLDPAVTRHTAVGE